MQRRRSKLTAACFAVVCHLLAAAFCGTAVAENWPQFRGIKASGVGDGNPPTEWNVEAGTNIKWKTQIPGLSHSSPIVWGERIFLTAAVSSSADEPELTKGWEAAAGHSAKDTGDWTWSLLCLDRGTGKEVWKRDAHQGVPKYKRHPKSSHANCTPATDGKHLVAFFGAEGLFCYDLDGELLWKKDLGALNASPKGYPDLQWGFASSPIIHDDLVIVQCDCENTNFWAAFDIKTGSEVRRVKRDEDSTWATPNVFEAGGRTQLVLNGYKHMGAYDLHTGEELWKLHGGGDVPVPAPLYGGGRIILTNAHGSSRPIYAILPDARGDMTPPQGRPPEGLAWWHKNKGSYIPTPIIYEDLLYVCSDEGILTVFDVSNGRQRYRQRLAGGGANYTASAVAAGGHVYFTSEDGDVHVVKAGQKYELVASNAMGEICMATPAISKGTLFFRTRHQLVAVGQ